MLCPTCPTERLVISERQGIEIDHCPTCRGVWLDRGELDKIIQRSSAAALDEVEAERREWAVAAPRTSGDDRRADHREHERRDHDDRVRPGGQPRKKRSSFLSDVFDL